MGSTARLLRVYRWWGFYTTPIRPVIRSEIRKHIHETAPRRVLEIGGGTGLLRGALSNSAEMFVCTDIAPTENTDLVCDGRALPFERAAFDLVVAFEVLEHVPDTDTFLRECARVLAPGGHLALSVPFMYGVHDFADYYRFAPQGLASKLSEHRLSVSRLRPIAGTFTTMTVLLTNWVRQLVIRERSGWRAGGRMERAAILAGALLTAPLTPIVWLAVALDRVLDRNSASPVGLFVLSSVETDLEL